MLPERGEKGDAGRRCRAWPVRRGGAREAARSLHPRGKLGYDAGMGGDGQERAAGPAVERIQRRLAVYVGPHTARLSIKTFSQRTFGVGPEALEPKDLPELVRALRPLVRSVLGESGAERLMRILLQECS